MDNEPWKMGCRRRYGCVLAIRLCINVDGAQAKEASRGLGLQRGRSGLVLVVKLCANAYAAVGEEGAFAGAGKCQKERSEAMRWKNSAVYNAATNARLPTGGDGGSDGAACGAVEGVSGARGPTRDVLRTAQGTCTVTHYHRRCIVIPTLCFHPCTPLRGRSTITFHFMPFLYSPVEFNCYWCPRKFANPPPPPPMLDGMLPSHVISQPPGRHRRVRRQARRRRLAVLLPPWTPRSQEVWTGWNGRDAMS